MVGILVPNGVTLMVWDNQDRQKECKVLTDSEIAHRQLASNVISTLQRKYRKVFAK